MATKLGIRMIEKYEEMVRDDFTPLINQLESREDSIREEVTVIVKKEMGIYDDYVKRAKLKLEIEELDKKIDKIEENNWTYGRSGSILDRAIAKKMDEVLGGEREQLEEARDQAKSNVRLMAIDDDMRDEMRRVTATVRELKDKYKSLPDPTVLLKGKTLPKGRK